MFNKLINLFKSKHKKEQPNPYPEIKTGDKCYYCGYGTIDENGWCMDCEQPLTKEAVEKFKSM